MMGPRDFINVVAFDDMAYNIVPLERVGTGRNAMARTSRIAIGGEPIFILACKWDTSNSRRPTPR